LVFNKIFWRQHLIIPLVFFATVILLLESSNIDITIANYFYNAATKSFYYKDHWLTSNVLHDGGKLVSVGIFFVIVSLLVASAKLEKLKKYNRGLAYLITSMTISALLVYFGKLFSHVHCPWDLALFGGDVPYIRTFSKLPATVSAGRCFPAAHASAGYALISLYFFSLIYARRYRFFALGIGLITGILYGGAQQLRGAHFLSHDVWTLLICWYTAFFVYIYFFMKTKMGSSLIKLQS